MNEEFVEMKFVLIKQKKKVNSHISPPSIHYFFPSDFLRDIVEVLIYILLPANEFRCVPARTIIRVDLIDILHGDLMEISSRK